MAMELKAIHENCSGCGVCRVVCALENFREVNPAKAGYVPRSVRWRRSK